jgi:hypothetical protein
MTKEEDDLLKGGGPGHGAWALIAVHPATSITIKNKPALSRVDTALAFAAARQAVRPRDGDGVHTRLS